MLRGTLVVIIIAAVVASVVAVAEQRSRTARSSCDGGGVVQKRFGLQRRTARPRAITRTQALTCQRTTARLLLRRGGGFDRRPRPGDSMDSQRPTCASSFATHRRQPLTTLGWTSNRHNRKPQSSASSSLILGHPIACPLPSRPRGKAPSCPSQRA